MIAPKSRLALAVVSLALTLAACRLPDADVAGATAEPALGAPDDPGGVEAGTRPPTLLVCTTPAREVASARIGPQGGSLGVGDHLLVVPPGALESEVTITAEALAVPRGNIVRFGPEGLVFARAATLTLSYANCGDDPARDEFVVLLNRTVGDRPVLERLPSTVDDAVRQVSAELQHFSRYAVAW
jgi:hypothetical protein